METWWIAIYLATILCCFSHTAEQWALMLPMLLKIESLQPALWLFSLLPVHQGQSSTTWNCRRAQSSYIQVWLHTWMKYTVFHWQSSQNLTWNSALELIKKIQDLLTTKQMKPKFNKSVVLLILSQTSEKGSCSHSIMQKRGSWQCLWKSEDACQQNLHHTHSACTHRATIQLIT